jgi:hypothetical protein
MSDVTRRALLHGVGATAAVVTAGALVPTTASASPRRGGADDADHPTASTSALVAHVSDAEAGEITLLAGDREVVVRDRALAQRLARLAD